MGESLWSLVDWDVSEWQLGNPVAGFHLGPNCFPMPGQRGYNLRPHNPTSRKPLSVPLTARFESSFEMTEGGHLQLPVDAAPKLDFWQTHCASTKVIAAARKHWFSCFLSKMLATIFVYLCVLLYSAALLLILTLLAHFEGFMNKSWTFHTFLSLFIKWP